jgi:hypothetical protein
MIFWTLLLAHILGDFPLQTDTIFRLKKRGSWGVLPHVLVCTIINIIALSPLLATKQAWIAIFVLAIVHAILDHSKIHISDKHARDDIFQFLFDQVLHILSIWFAAAWLSQNTPEPFHSYLNQEVTISLIALIFAAFGSVPILYYMNRYFFRKTVNMQSFVYPPFLKRVPGLFERFLATLGIIWGGWWYVLTIVAFIPRMIINWREEEHKVTFVNFFISILICILCGLFVIFYT